ncbi:MAG: sugar transferase [Actinomycetota bacterium]|nr:sugar transferase [Actinomycetota bacterium]
MIVGAALLALLTPLIVALLAAMGVDAIVSPRDRGSFFYREPRISRGRPFGLLKFRTLRRDVLDQMRVANGHARLYEANPGNLTWTGRRLLKPWYLDEVPQLLNVLRGDISLVGPRPWPPEMVERQVAEGRDYRNRILAGLTGPAQVTKGEGIPFDDLDAQYLQHCDALSPWALVGYDLQILWRTVVVIARGEGLNY